ncbi:MAG: hypothetical protein ACK5Q5_04235 [Planctomycetaceae bacterium]
MMQTLFRGMGLLLAVAVVAYAQPPESAATPPKVDITIEQQALLRDYEGFEKRLAELAESLRSSDLDRSNLLLMARSESQKQQVQQRLKEIATILSDEKPYADAVERQKLVVKHMEEILTILQTDANWDKLQARIKELEARAKEAGRLIALQKDVRADTERGGEFRPLNDAQRKVLEAADNLAEKIDAEEARRAAEEGRPAAEGQPNNGPEPEQIEGQPPSDKSPQDPSDSDGSKPREPPSDDSKPEQNKSESSPRGDQKPGEPQSGEPSPMGQPSPSPPQPGQPQDQQSPGQQQPGEQQEAAPGRQDLEEARKEMQQAIEELKKENRDRASNEQDAAIAKLEQMKAKIEEILRQLRQEEKEMYLTQLEARFQEMLKLQLRINADTVRLDARDRAERGEAHFTKGRDLSRQEQQNVLAADKAYALLVEEGSSVAFPEAVEQLKSNMEAVTVRLAKGDTGETSQLIEKLIVESLEEMVLSLQKELEKLKQDQQQKPPQQLQQQDRSLVDQLAELKMIRSLQNQVNRLTKQVGLEIEGERAQDPDTLKLLRDLSRRQERIQEATYDLSTGKNR